MANIRKVTFEDFPEGKSDDNNLYLVGFSSDLAGDNLKERKFAIRKIFLGSNGIYIKGDDTGKWYRLRIKGSVNKEYLGFDEGVDNPDDEN